MGHSRPSNSAPAPTVVCCHPESDQKWCGAAKITVRRRGIRDLARQQGAWANIPPKQNLKDPICFSPNLYRVRNLIERFLDKIKQCRRVATRHDKLAANYLAFIKLASIRIWLRANERHALNRRIEIIAPVYLWRLFPCPNPSNCLVTGRTNTGRPAGNHRLHGEGTMTEPFAYSIAEACAKARCGRTALYEARTQNAHPC